MKIEEFEFNESIQIVYMIEKRIHGTVENLGAYASIVKYKIDEVEYEELLDNEEFIVLDEINIGHAIQKHIEDDK